MSDRPWPFTEASGRWDGRTWRWCGDSITLAQADTLNSMAPRWTWTVRSLYAEAESEYEFSLTRWGVDGPPPEAAPLPRRTRWSKR